MTEEQKHIQSGKLLGKQYKGILERIYSVTQRKNDEIRILEDMPISSSLNSSGEHSNDISRPTERLAIELEKYRTMIDNQYANELAELREKRQDLESIIGTAELDSREERVFYLRHGSTTYTIEEIAADTGYSERMVGRLIQSMYIKIGQIL